MPRYMALITETINKVRTPEEIAAMHAEYLAFGEEAGAAGVIVGGGEALHDHSTGTTIHVDGRGGSVQVIDAPYAEAKEVCGGYYLLDVDDLDQAVAWAAKIPGAWHGKVEVRPCIDFTAM